MNKGSAVGTSADSISPYRSLTFYGGYGSDHSRCCFLGS